MKGAEYAEIRKRLGLTQKQLAEAVGVAVSTVQLREQQPDKDVPSEAAMAIESLAAEHEDEHTSTARGV